MRVLVAGHRGLVGSAVCRRLAAEPDVEVLTGRDTDFARDELYPLFNYLSGEADRSGVNSTPIDAMVICAARVGGIVANSGDQSSFLHENLEIQRNLFKLARMFEIERVIFLGSVCSYPRDAGRNLIRAEPHAITEDQLHCGPLEPTNRAYAIAKLVGLEEIRVMRPVFPLWTALMPSNLYGPSDNFNLYAAHALPALLRKIQLQLPDGRSIVPHPQLEVWGNPETLREWTYVDDLADAIRVVLRAKEIAHELYNVGSGDLVSMGTLVQLLQKIAGTDYPVNWRSDMPSGAPIRFLSSARFMEAFDWRRKTQLLDGIAKTWAWMQEHKDELRA